MEKNNFIKYVISFSLGLFFCILLHIFLNFYISLKELEIKESETITNTQIKQNMNEEFLLMLKFMETVIEKTTKDNN